MTSTSDVRSILMRAGAHTVVILETPEKLHVSFSRGEESYRLSFPVKEVGPDELAKMLRNPRHDVASARAELLEAYVSVAWAGVSEWLECRLSGVGLYETFEQSFAGHRYTVTGRLALDE